MLPLFNALIFNSLLKNRKRQYCVANAAFRINLYLPLLSMGDTGDGKPYPIHRGFSRWRYT